MLSRSGMFGSDMERIKLLNCVERKGSDVMWRLSATQRYHVMQTPQNSLPVIFQMDCKNLLCRIWRQKSPGWLNNQHTDRHRWKYSTKAMFL